MLSVPNMSLWYLNHNYKVICQKSKFWLTTTILVISPAPCNLISHYDPWCYYLLYSIIRAFILEFVIDMCDTFPYGSGKFLCSELVYASHYISFSTSLTIHEKSKIKLKIYEKFLQNRKIMIFMDFSITIHLRPCDRFQFWWYWIW